MFPVSDLYVILSRDIKMGAYLMMVNPGDSVMKFKVSNLKIGDLILGIYQKRWVADFFLRELSSIIGCPV